MLSPQRDSTNDCGFTLIDHKQPSHVSNLAIKNQVDTDSNNYDDTQYFVTPRKQNKNTPEITYTTTKTTLVQPNVY